MARVSKRVNKVEHTSVQKERKTYYVGIYARLSSDKNELKNESIDTQVTIIRRFVADYNKSNEDEMVIFEVYKDLGKTGTNFARMEFMRLMEDIRRGDVNCVIVKDFSRFGRDYMEVGNYIEKIFPFLGVRFISLSDHYDTADPKNSDRKFAMNIKNLVNEMYARDFSKRGKVQLQQRRKKGSYVGGVTPYGYNFEWVDKIKKLRIDDETAPVVKKIFLMFREKKNYAAVTRWLNEKRINPPFVYYKTGELYCKADSYKGWDKGAVTRILSNKVYIGFLEQGKTEITLKKIVKRVEEENWIRIRAHDSIVDESLYEEVQKIRMDIKRKFENQKKPIKDLHDNEDIFHDILYCGICKRKLVRHRSSYQYRLDEMKRQHFYECKNTYNNYKSLPCESTRIRGDILVQLILKQIKQEFTMCMDQERVVNEHYKNISHIIWRRFHRASDDIKHKIKIVENEKAELYMWYKEGMLVQRSYIERKEQMDKVLKDLNMQDTNLKKSGEIHSSKLEQGRQNPDHLFNIYQEEYVTKNLLDYFVDRVYLYPGKRIELVFSFQDIFTV